MVNAVDKAYAAVRADIVDGTCPPGSHLKEEDLAARIGVSRTPVREALRRLDAEGIVIFVPNQGARVASWSDRDIAEIFGLRMLLESYGASLAARNITVGQIAEMRRLAERMEAAAQSGGDDFVDRIAEANDRFHRLLLDAAGNARLTAMLSRVIEIPLVLGTFRRYSDEDLQRSLGHHRELLAALEAHDPQWAESVMRSHIHAARRVFQPPDAAGPSADGDRPG